MSQLPEHLISNISSYNSTTYAENEINIEFDYDPWVDYSDPTGTFSCNITIKLDTNIAAYWRRHLVYRTQGLYDGVYTNNDYERQEINAKLKQLPDYNTIFGNIDNHGLVTIDLDGSNEDEIELFCMFYYEKEANDFENEYFEPVDFRSDKGLKMRKAAAFLVAHTIVKTLKYIIPPPETSVQDYLTFDEDGDRINQKGEYFSDDDDFDDIRDLDNDYKLHKKDKRIYSLDFWLKKVSYDINITLTCVKFTLVNNMRLPITRGSEGVSIRQLKF